MSEAPPPKDPDTAIRVFIGLFVLGFVLRGIDTMDADIWGAIEKWAVAAVLAIVDFFWPRVSTLLGPTFSATAIRVTTDFRWWAAVLITLLIVSSLSPFVEQRRWPFASGHVAEPTKSLLLGLDDAKRWQLAYSLFHLSATSSSRVPACNARVWQKPNSASAASFWNETMLLFYLGDWGLGGGQKQKGYFPDGISIAVRSDHGDAFDCGVHLREWLDSMNIKNVSLKANETTPDLVDCKTDCIEIVIGDVAVDH